ncbi:hypothetical protein [Vibrio navarrensis]|uniref:hypothetical protein n=1 Tax=Vibrio navarrensis TaxID=29495 RepID=UPI0018686CC7|nr:hypothetical protein [Vibrio navarrensis]MBE3654871.1 hypothetical protein [Vibrio navarrensis]
MWKLIKAMFSSDWKPDGEQDSLFERVEHELKLKKLKEDNLTALFVEQLQVLENHLNSLFGTSGKVEAFVNGQKQLVKPIYVSEWIDEFERFHEKSELKFCVNFQFYHSPIIEIVEAKALQGDVLFKHRDSTGSFQSAVEFADSIKKMVLEKVGLNATNTDL